MVYTGFSDVIGSWKIMAIWAPRTLCISSSVSSSRLRPWKTISPVTISPAGGSMRRMIDIAVTDLPEPDSPTTPRRSPGIIAKSTPSTARTTPSSVEK